MQVVFTSNASCICSKCKLRLVKMQVAYVQNASCVLFYSRGGAYLAYREVHTLPTYTQHQTQGRLQVAKGHTGLCKAIDSLQPPPNASSKSKYHQVYQLRKL